ncbi:helix-turn-helix transcriptional regulator [Cryobacterium sp. PH31-L1]|uniref:helix-turn-helix transcriptional regulator n=1 Tax=Cryobacterium sp. PH31-L1 TaxID=3046199 RepID=UPI0024BA5907|nr:helix-turn-helix transcriptional regulator [Cryobacterium sp. PH31-L1]MDJ0376445.1 helix-turn-helix transcriptional regulator [Cryobacterium sp. PH31-L1]
MPEKRRTPIPVRRAIRELGADAQTWRKLLGLTMEQVADRAGVSRGTLAKLESGNGGVSLETTLRIFRALGIMDTIVSSADPYRSDLGRLRSEEILPQRVRQSTPKRVSHD